MAAEFLYEKHIDYIKVISQDKESFEFVVTEHLRMSGVYWGITAMAILGRDLKTEMNSDVIVDWVMQCYHEDIGGFGGNIGHDAHLLYTLSALQILLLCDSLDRVDKDRVAQYVASLQQADGSFVGDKWGEVDTRFSYCSLYSLAILGKLESGLVDISKAVEFVARCRNFDGGFGAVPGAESHAAQVFCCIAMLSIAGALHIVDVDLLGWWLSERQCDSGGLNGRPEKQADVCYSWWILSCMSILGRESWIDKDKLIGFILSCQDDATGGLADQPGNMVDIFHTFFGVCGLSLLGFFKTAGEGGESTSLSYAGRIREVNPTFALPSDVVARYNLIGQTLPKV